MEKPNSDLTVLLVDDSLSMRRIVVKFLANNGFTHVLEAGDGSQALGIISSTRVDLIVSDLNMPGMDGMTFLKQIKATPETRGIKFIMLTVEAIQKTMNKALCLGVDSYIVKPVTETLFMEELTRVMRLQEGD